MDFAISQACINYNIGYEAGYLGKDLGIESTPIVDLLKKVDKDRERILKPKPRKIRKIEADHHYKAGGF